MPRNQHGLENFGLALDADLTGFYIELFLRNFKWSLQVIHNLRSAALMQMPFLRCNLKR